MIKRTSVHLLLSVSLCLAAAGCGKRGDPLPPFKHLPYNQFRMIVTQQGERAMLRLTIPRTTREGKPFEKEDFGKLEVYCLAEKDTGEEERKFEDIDIDEEKDDKPAGPQGGMMGGGGMKIIGGVGGGMPGESAGWQSMEDDQGLGGIDTSRFRGTGMTDIFPRDVFERKADRVFVVEKDTLDDYTAGWLISIPMQFEDLEQEDIYDKRLYFGVKLFNSRGQDDGLSNLVALAPDVIPEPPGSFTAEVTQTSVNLTWDSPGAMADGSEIGGDIGYVVFRATENKDFNTLPLNAQPLLTTEFVDKTFSFNKNYRYIVRSAIITEKGIKASENSEELILTPKDTFPPGTPREMNSVKGEGEITLIWAPNIENDLQGYNIYRSTERETGFIRLNEEPISKNAFTDENVEADKTYYYKVTAEDNAEPSNESGFSETVAETLS
jgi:hypothetical protein